MNMNLVKGAAALGLAAIGTSALLQKGYKTFDFYPPNFVYIFFTAVLAYGLIEGIEHISGKELIEG